MEKLISQFPKFAPAYYQKGYINTFYLNKHEHAVTDFTRAISLNKGGKSDLILFLWMRGFAKQQMSNIQGACIDWQYALGIGDEIAESNLKNYCGPSDYLLSKRPNFVKAESLFEKGISKTEIGDYESAIVYFKKVIDIDPLSAEAMYNLGSAYSALGKYEDALVFFATSLYFFE